MMNLTNIEYIILRFIRKFFFTTNLLNYVGKYICYYQTNANQQYPNGVAQSYLKHMNQSLEDKMVVEIGVGATNSIGYELVALTNCKYTGIEPFVNFNRKLDRAVLDKVTQDYPHIKTSSISRINDIKSIADNSVDVLLSNSVLEHVTDMESLCKEMRRVLKHDGIMLHVVDYRDHFFKYPFHFLQFSKTTWNRWLNPGDLPRWRLSNHLEIFENNGFRPHVVEMKRDTDNFTKIRAYLHYDFKNNDPLIDVTTAVLIVNARQN